MEGGREEERRKGMKYSANGLIVGRNNKKSTIIKSMEQHGINWMDKTEQIFLKMDSNYLFTKFLSRVIAVLKITTTYSLKLLRSA